MYLPIEWVEEVRTPQLAVVIYQTILKTRGSLTSHPLHQLGAQVYHLELHQTTADREAMTTDLAIASIHQAAIQVSRLQETVLEVLVALTGSHQVLLI